MQKKILDITKSYMLLTCMNQMITELVPECLFTFLLFCQNSAIYHVKGGQILSFYNLSDAFCHLFCVITSWYTMVNTDD